MEGGDDAEQEDSNGNPDDRHDALSAVAQRKAQQGDHHTGDQNDAPHQHELVLLLLLVGHDTCLSTSYSLSTALSLYIPSVSKVVPETWNIYILYYKYVKYSSLIHYVYVDGRC